MCYRSRPCGIRNGEEKRVHARSTRWNTSMARPTVPSGAPAPERPEPSLITTLVAMARPVNTAPAAGGRSLFSSRDSNRSPRCRVCPRGGWNRWHRDVRHVGEVRQLGEHDGREATRQSRRHHQPLGKVSPVPVLWPRSSARPQREHGPPGLAGQQWGSRSQRPT
jgi:hypothetical protein